MKRWIIVAVVLAGIGIAAFFGLKTYVESTVAARFDEAAQGLHDASLSFADVNADILAGTVTLRDVRYLPAGAEEGAFFGAVEIKDVDRDHQPPHHAHVRLHDIDINTTEIEAFFVLAGVAPYEHARGRVEFAYRYDEEARTLEVDVPDAWFERSGTLQARAKFANVSLPGDIAESEPNGLLERFAGVTLRWLQADYDDNFLFDRILFWASYQQGAPGPESLRNQMLDAMRNELSRLPDERSIEAMEQLIRFVDLPGKISISAKPSPPVRLDDLILSGRLMPINLPVLLDLEAEAVRDTDFALPSG